MAATVSASVDRNRIKSASASGSVLQSAWNTKNSNPQTKVSEQAQGPDHHMIMERRSFSSQGIRQLDNSLQGSFAEIVENPYVRERVSQSKVVQRVSQSSYEQNSKARSSGTQLASKAQDFALKETDFQGHIVQTSEISPRMTNTHSNQPKENSHFHFGVGKAPEQIIKVTSHRKKHPKPASLPKKVNYTQVNPYNYKLDPNVTSHGFSLEQPIQSHLQQPLKQRAQQQVRGAQFRLNSEGPVRQNSQDAYKVPQGQRLFNRTSGFANQAKIQQALKIQRPQSQKLLPILVHK